jgi:hypothetical protein
MAIPRTKTATVSVPPRATVNITLTFKKDGKPVVGATAAAQPSSGAVRGLGKTNTAGALKNVKLDPDDAVTIVVIFKNHRGEGLPEGFAGNPNSSQIFSGVLGQGTRNFNVQMVQIASQVTVTVLDSNSNLALAGTQVSTGAFKGSGDRNGKVVTDGLAGGLLHTITAVHSGFGPEGSGTEGPATATVDLRNVTAITDATLTIKMKPIFGTVKSSKITVESLDFPAFYKSFVAGFPKNHPTIRVRGQATLSYPVFSNTQQFKDLFDDLAQWAGKPEITLEEFVAIYLIFANETGGSFRPLAEQGTLSYFFYLNKPSNRLAGTQLSERGIISDPALITAWNATGKVNASASGCVNFPGTASPPPTDADITECDFNKYRGRGFVQLTLFPIYLRILEPALLAAGFPGCEKMTSAELDNAVLTNKQVYYGMLQNYLNTVRDSWGLANSQQWRQFGLTVAGQDNKGYGDLFQFRAENLFARMEKAARAGQLDLK